MRLPKKLKIFASFYSSGIFNGITGVNINYKDINLPIELKFLFIDWMKLYEELWNINYTEMDPKKTKLLNKRGLELATKLKKVYPKIEITYYETNTSENKIHEPVKV